MAIGAAAVAFRRRRGALTSPLPFARPRRAYGGVIKFILLLLVLGRSCRRRLLAAPYDQQDGGELPKRRTCVASLARWRNPLPAKPKISDRVGPGSGTSSSANAPAAAVAQKVALYDEDPNDPKGKRYVGSALWRTETVSPGPGLAPELAVRADVEIPEQHVRMTWSLRRNSDKALPASHTIEIDVHAAGGFFRRRHSIIFPAC